MVDRDQEYVEFVDAASGSLRRTAFLVCGDWYRADDIVQDALYKLYRQGHPDRLRQERQGPQGRPGLIRLDGR